MQKRPVTPAKPAEKAATEALMSTEYAEEDTDFVKPTEDSPAFCWEDVVWYNVAILASWHVGALYSLWFVLPTCSMSQLLVLWVVLWFFAGLGITAGAHRLWSHRSYKAKLPLRVFLMLCNSMAFEGSIFEWSRDHRVHHKGSDTTADPHNSGRGFFFSHMGWVMMRKHKNVRITGKKMDFSDLLADPVVVWQLKHYLPSVLVMCYGLPTFTGYLMGNAWAGFWVGGMFRHVWVLHMTWMVNSVAHFFGYKPYDRNIRAVENLIVSIGAIGEGYHNYHHKYPSDYGMTEWGLLGGHFNPTKIFIDFCALIGQAYGLKRSRTAAKTRERAARKEEEERLQTGLSPAMSWYDRALTQLFFGKPEANIFQ